MSSPVAKLSHVNAKGEAHMVDVGAKPSTKRLAIAVARVDFSNAEVARQIEENSNKKGDVFAAARIAGIMAAKKTPDLIPLCHPIMIAKAEVDMSLRATSGHPQVAIEARVECDGATGVEMEALTAASVAALTIYDMCKAVDKAMDISRTTLVYKSNGPQCKYVRPSWIDGDSQTFFAERGLQQPDESTVRGAD